MKKILALNNEIEANLVKSLLEEENIPHIIRSYYDSAYDGLFQQSKGWGHLEADEQYEDKILTIYKSIRE